jgi:SAM-dependent methyltransferase
LSFFIYERWTLPVKFMTFRRIFFNFWYFGRPPWDAGLSPPELYKLLERLTPGRAIDLGCGSGTHSLTLARRGWQVTGVDFAPRAIRLARKKARQANLPVQFITGDVTRLDGVIGMFDLAIDFGCMHGLPEPDRRRYLEQLGRILPQGGLWFLYTVLDPPLGSSGPGLASAFLEQVSPSFSMLERQDGLDKKNRHSAYFLFEKK